MLETEWCDGQDNDCDGQIDNGNVCPDANIANTTAFSDKAYFLGTTSEGSCGADALQAFWPQLATTYFSGFDCYADTYAFRPENDQNYYFATFSGIRQNLDPDDPVVLTPPCGDRVGRDFSFDGAGTLHYRCADTLRRGNGELIAQLIQRLVTVLADGTIFVRERDPLTTFDEQILAYKNDGQLENLWREADAGTVRAHIGDQMLVGP